MVRGRRIAVAAASDADVRRGDELQLECGQGPGVEAILTRQSFNADDLRLDDRWRFWGPQAARLGWLSVLSVGLADGDTFGSLTLYSRQVHSFGPTDVAVAEAFAAHAAMAVGDRPRATVAVGGDESPPIAAVRAKDHGQATARECRASVHPAAPDCSPG